MKTVPPNPALVFNCHFNGLGVIQALGRMGVRVFALDSVRSIGTWSRHARFLRCPDPLEAETAFINFLLEEAPVFQTPPVLFPTNDHWAIAISMHKERLQKHYLPCVADWGTVELLVNKDRFYAWGMERGYPVPRLYGRGQIAPEDFPVVAKPRFRRMPNLLEKSPALLRLLDMHRMDILASPCEFENYLVANEEILDYMIFLEYVPGMADCMHTVGIYADSESEVLGVFTGRKVRGFPPDIGDCIVGQAEGIPPELISLVRTLVKDLRYQGIAEFEFKRNPKTGDFKLIEINPRSWSWIGITPACGVNLPWIAYTDLVGIGVPGSLQSTVYDGEVKYVRLIDDLTNCLCANRKAGFPQYHMSLRGWWRSLSARKRVYAEFSRDDPATALYCLVTYVRRVVVGRLYRMLRRPKSESTRSNDG